MGRHDRNPFKTLTDFNNDEWMDLLVLEVDKPSTIRDARLRTYTSQGNIDTATCFATTDPANPSGCAFVEQLGVELGTISDNQWVINQSRDAVDVDGDGYRDVAVWTLSSGGNSPAPVYILYGNGDGTFQPPDSMFSHNSGQCGDSPANALLFADFNGDDLGDIVMGFDDDGDAGSGWFYPGLLDMNGVFGFDLRNCEEAMDVNPTDESGGDNPGVGGSARNFDFNFDGNVDVMIGYNHKSAWSKPSQTEIWLGQGDGLFEFYDVVREFPDSTWAGSFATPQPMCPRFPIAKE